MLRPPCPRRFAPSSSQAWAVFDPDANQLIPADQLPDLLVRIPPPLGLKKDGVAGEELLRQAVRYCMKLDLPEYDGEVKFQEVLDSLVNTNYTKGLEEGLPDAETGPDEVKKLVYARKRRTTGSFEVAEDGSVRESTPSKRESKVLKQFASQIIRNYIRKKQPVPGTPDTPPML